MYGTSLFKTLLYHFKYLWCFQLLLLSTGISTSLLAETLTRLEVNSEGGEYSIRLEMTLDAPAKYIREVLTDYVHIYRLNSSIINSHIMQSHEENTTRVYTRISDCVLFYCTEIERVEDVQENAAGNLVAVIVPEYSDFESGITSWLITEKNGKAHIVYDAVMRPRFFIPPVAGDYFVKSKLKQSLMTSFKRIECNAKVRQFIVETGDGAVNAIAVKQRNAGFC